MTFVRPIPAAAASLLLLSGCALWTRHSPEADSAWNARRAALQHVHAFGVQARVSAGGPFGGKGNLFWRQRADGFDLRVTGPMGGGVLLLHGEGERVEIRTPEEQFTTTDPERLLRERLGWSFPVSRLRYWALGVPAPGSPADVELDEAGRVTALAQDDWVMEYDEYRAFGAFDLPRRFQLGNRDIRIKVVVDAWTDVAVTAAP